MKNNNIPIEKGQNLKAVLDEIPTNTILNKTICGVGATWLEIKSERHSIIIEPNVPVIEGKAKEHPELLGVKEGVSAEDIKQYIHNCKDWVKLMTTPESFCKVKKALSELKINYHTDYFLLFDECEKIVEDIGYRNTIALPVEEFFNFDNKAMVSATPIIPADPRFTKYGFQMLTIKPNYDHKRDLHLHPTNNVYCTLRKVLDSIEPENKEPICIFFNSTDGIDEIISLLDIKSESNIYCGAESVEKLCDRGYKNVSDSLFTDNGKIKLKRYNFFTSRFYSAVDIKINEKPIVILLTEVFLASHSKIDARTDAIQIAGRFRNGIGKYIHITNYNSKAEYKGHKAMEDFLEGQHTIYSEFLIRKLNSRHHGEIHLLNEFLNTTSYRIYVTNKGDKNHFMYHNAFIEDELKGVYRYPAPIKARYDGAGAFNVFSQNIYSRYTDKDRRLLNNKSKTRTELNKLAFYQIKALLKSKKKDIYDIQYLRQLQSGYAFIFDAIRLLGEKKIVEYGFKESKIRTEMITVQSKNEFTRPDILKAVHAYFKENHWYKTAEINEVLTNVYVQNGIKLTKRVPGKQICEYYDAVHERKNYADGWMLGKRRYSKS